MRGELSFWGAVALLVGTQIGAGVLGLPHILAPLGFFWGTVVLFLAALFSAITAVMLVEALYLSNPNFHYFDLSTEYLGNWGKLLTLFIIYAGYGALLAYTSGLSSVIADIVGGSPQFWAAIVWAVLSFVVLLGLRVSGAAEETLTIIIVLLVLTMFLWALPIMKPFYMPFSMVPFSIAFSVSVFAFFGHTVIPEVVRGVRNMGRTILVILTAFSLVFIVYVLFSLSVLGVLGKDVPEIGTLGLVDILEGELAPIAYALPLLTITTSFIGVGIAQKDILREIFRNRFVSWLLAVVPPIVLYFLGVQGFVTVIEAASIGIVIAAGIIPPLVLLRARKERGRVLTPIPTWLVRVTIFIYSLVLLFTVLDVLGVF